MASLSGPRAARSGNCLVANPVMPTRMNHGASTKIPNRLRKNVIMVIGRSAVRCLPIAVKLTTQTDASRVQPAARVAGDRVPNRSAKLFIEDMALIYCIMRGKR